MSNGPFTGQTNDFSDTSEYNAEEFHIEQMLGDVRTAYPVKVIAVHGGGVGGNPTVDVQPTINQIDGDGNQTAHGTVFGIGVLRIHSGTFSIIADPVVGDFGLVLCSDRDISAVQANNGAQSNPGSRRRFNLADGMYLGGIYAKDAPTQYIEATKDGITILDKTGNKVEMLSTGVKITSATINLNGLQIDSSGNLTTPGGVQAGTGGADAVTLQNHQHPGNNLPPTPGH